MVKPIKKRSPLWYELPLILQIIGGIIAYVLIRKDDPKKARNCLFLGIVLTVIQIFIIVGLMTSLGTENPLFVIASGSMTPELQVYDIVVINGNEPFESLTIGDVIVFHRPSGADRIIVHRIVSIELEEPFTLKTKGDANHSSINGTDFPITKQEYIGKVVNVIPQLGYVTQVLKPPVNYSIFLFILIIPVILHFRFKAENSDAS
ncbi:MAG: signal peptidase I [Nitrosopumilus sp.]|nr:signal peptidase I [Nitrosopumilus sp.]MDH3384941.1 signal peptidase I [Nitrosopumilus sp.]